MAGSGRMAGTREPHQGTAGSVGVMREPRQRTAGSVGRTWEPHQRMAGLVGQTREPRQGCVTVGAGCLPSRYPAHLSAQSAVEVGLRTAGSCPDDMEQPTLATGIDGIEP